MYLDNNETERAIKILLLDEKGKSLPYALKLALEHDKNLHNVPLEQGCSVNIISQRTAQYYLHNNEKRKAVACAEYFVEDKDKINLYKKADQIKKAEQMLFTNKQYDDLYRLLKSQENFEKGVETAKELNNNIAHCEFLLLLVKKKLSVAEYDGDKLKDAEMLEKANNSLCDSSVILKLQVELICGILKEDPLDCFNVCKKFITTNHFGAIEALNAAVNFKTPNLDLAKVIVFVKCLLFAYDIVSDIEKSGKLSKHLQLQFRKFYEFEQSKGKFFLPPCQFYWMPKLKKKCLAEKDSDGMFQFDELKVYKLLKEHLENICHKWLLLDLEKVLFSIMTSKRYVLLNSVLNKKLDIQTFAIRTYDISIYLTCCVRLIEIAHFHDGKNIKCCVVEDNSNKVKIQKWSTLSDYAAIRLFNIFSPEWCYYFIFSDEHIRMIKNSQVACNVLFTMLHSDKKVKNNINAFLKNWRILKLTDCDASTLVKCLKDEEAKIKTKHDKPSSAVSEQKVNDKQPTLSTDGQISTKQTNQSPLDEAFFISSNSNYTHIFFAWLQGCKYLENVNFMGFAEGIIEQLFVLIAKRKSFKPKITILNIIYVLEIISIGLFGSLQVVDAHVSRRNLSIKILLPKFYEHLVASFDPINFTPHTFLDLVANSVGKSQNFKQIYTNSLYLLQRTFHLLLGKIQPSFNVLHHASLRSVYDNGFQRCLVLCLSVLGNLWPLLHKTQRLSMLATLKTTVLKSCPDIIKDNFPKLFTNLQNIQEIKNSKDIFNILFSIQNDSQSYIVSFQYNYSSETDVKGRPFSFSKTDPEHFSKLLLKDTTPIENTKQRQQHVQQHHHDKWSNKPTVAWPVERSMQHVKQSTKKVPRNSYAYSQTSKVTVMLESPPVDHNKFYNQSDVDKEQTVASLPPLSLTKTTQSFNSETKDILTVYSQSMQANSDETLGTGGTTLASIQMPNFESENTDKLVENIVNNKMTSENIVVDNEQSCPVEIIDLVPSHHNTKISSSDPSFPSFNNVNNTEMDLSAEYFHFLQLSPSDDGINDNSTTLQSVSVSTPVQATTSPGLLESHGAVAAETSVQFTTTKDHQLQNVAPSIVDNESVFQSELKPDAEPFESRLNTTESIVSGFSSNSSEKEKEQDLKLHATHQQTGYQTVSDPNVQMYYPAGLALNPSTSFPFTANYHPLTGQLMYIPTIPHLYWPNPPINPQPYYAYGYTTSAWPPQPQVGEGFQKFLPSGNVETLANASNPKYCYECGVSINDEQSKQNHYTSAEHRCKMKEYLAYQEIEEKCTKVFEDAERVINSTRRKVHLGIQTQIDKIKECKKKFDRVKSQIEVGATWSNGLILIQGYAEEINQLLKEYYDLIHLIKEY